MKQARVKLEAVQGLRAFAAGLVVVHHGQVEAAALAARAGLAFAPSALLPWSAGVDVFFVISGFIIVHASAPLYGRAGGRARFLAHRIARLVPLYWLVTALYLALVLAAPGLLNGAEAPAPGYVAASFLFWPAARPDSIPQPLYGLGWTLNCEMFFYAVFAVGLGWGRAKAVAWLCAALLGLVALAEVVPDPPTPLAFWGSPIVLEFAVGAGLALARAHGLRLSVAARFALALAGLVGLAWAGEVGADLRPLLYGGPALLLVAAAALGRVGDRPHASRGQRGSPHLPGEGQDEGCGLSEKVPHLTPALSFQERERRRVARQPIRASDKLLSRCVNPLGRVREGARKPARPVAALVAALVALGDASYALYLIHPFVLRGTREAIGRLGLAGLVGPWGALGLMLVLSVAAALVVARLVEAPLTRAVRRRLDPGVSPKTV